MKTSDVHQKARTGLTLTYQAMLASALSERAKRNARFSLRAFAKQIHVQPSQLSRVLAGKAHFSKSAAKGIAKKAFDSELTQELFIKLVHVANTRDDASHPLVQNIQTLLALQDQRVIDPSDDVPFTSWKDFAALEATELKAFQPEPKWLAAVLGIDEAEARAVLERLIRVGLLKVITRKGKSTLVKSNLKIETKDGVPSKVMRNIQGEFLDSAKSAMRSQPIERRKYAMRTVAIREQDWAALKAAANRFMATVSKLTYYESNPLEDVGQADRIVQIQLQMFGISSEDTKYEE